MPSRNRTQTKETFCRNIAATLQKPCRNLANAKQKPSKGLDRILAGQFCQAGQFWRGATLDFRSDLSFFFGLASFAEGVNLRFQI